MGTLFGVDSSGAQYRVVSKDVGVRLNKPGPGPGQGRFSRLPGSCEEDHWKRTGELC